MLRDCSRRILLSVPSTRVVSLRKLSQACKNAFKNLMQGCLRIDPLRTGVPAMYELLQTWGRVNVSFFSPSPRSKLWRQTPCLTSLTTREKTLRAAPSRQRPWELFRLKNPQVPDCIHGAHVIEHWQQYRASSHFFEHGSANSGHSPVGGEQSTARKPAAAQALSSSTSMSPTGGVGVSAGGSGAKEGSVRTTGVDGLPTAGLTKSSSSIGAMSASGSATNLINTSGRGGSIGLGVSPSGSVIS